jgi:hypothetical protein
LYWTQGIQGGSSLAIALAKLKYSRFILISP